MTGETYGKPLRILISGIGGPTPASIALSLKRHSRYADCQILGLDANPHAAGLYRSDIVDLAAVVPLAQAIDYWPTIERLVAEHGIDLAIIQPEVEVIEWCRREDQGRLPCPAFLPQLKLAKVLVDKSATTHILRNSGLVPKSVTLYRDLCGIDEVENHLEYPFWIRAAAGTSGLGSLLVDSRKMLSSWVSINKDVQDFLCSEYLPGRNLACKLLYHNGDLVRAACAERLSYIMAKVAPSGVTGNTSFGRFLNDQGPIQAATSAMDVLFRHSAAKRHGLFTVDFKETIDGKPQITEVNVRNVAFNGCFAELGANFSEDIVRLATLDESFDRTYKQYQFDDDYIFIRDVDVEPLVMRRSKLFEGFGQC